MKTVSVEVYPKTSNNWIDRTPGRNFPALVVQGDSFSMIVQGVVRLTAFAESVAPRPEHADEAKYRVDFLGERLDCFAQIFTAVDFHGDGNAIERNV